jgi:spore germination protein
MIYRRLSMALFPILAIAFIGTAVWGYKEHQDKNSVLIKAENQYQRAFHDLSYHMDKLHQELGNTLAVNSTSQGSYRKGLVNVWRITSEAQSDITQLPLSLLPFNKTQEFLANMANFSYKTSIRDLTKQPMSDNEIKTLNSLYGYSKQLNTEIQGVQDKVITNNLRWMDVEVALASEKGPNDNVIIDGFSTVDKKVGGYPEINWGPGGATILNKMNMQALSGNEMSPQEIKQKAAAFLKNADTSAMQVTANGGTNTDYQSYSVTIPGGKNHDNDVQMDFTKKGGQLVYYMHPRSVSETKLDVRQARDVASEFLDQRGYNNMSAVSYDQYHNVANLTFAKRENDITIYPQQINVTVALDNGEITGLQTTDYVFGQKERKFAAPKVNAEEARKTLSGAMEITSKSLAVIKDNMDQEILCHEFLGSMNGNHYRIYVNGETGVEEKVETIRPQEVKAIAK